MDEAGVMTWIDDSVVVRMFGGDWASTVPDGKVVYTYRARRFDEVDFTADGFTEINMGMSLPMKTVMSLSAIRVHASKRTFIENLCQTQDHETVHTFHLVDDPDRSSDNEWDEVTAERFRRAGAWARRE